MGLHEINCARHQHKAFYHHPYLLFPLPFSFFIPLLDFPLETLQVPYLGLGQVEVSSHRHPAPSRSTSPASPRRWLQLPSPGIFCSRWKAQAGRCGVMSSCLHPETEESHIPEVGASGPQPALTGRPEAEEARKGAWLLGEQRQPQCCEATAQPAVQVRLIYLMEDHQV